MKTRNKFMPPSGRGGEGALVILWAVFWFGALWSAFG